jgi:predicted PhzF superfamily epimerase YddE/YHI9
MSSPSQLEFVTVDVFTTERYSGNPLAIIRIPHGVTMSQEQKQMIAREFNLSESTFLHEKSPSAPGNTWVVDIFLTTAEIPFAGHPTIGTACYVLSRAAQERGLEDGVIEAGFQLKAGPVGLVYDVAKKTARAAIPHDVSVPPEALSIALTNIHLAIYTGKDGADKISSGCSLDLLKVMSNASSASKMILR